MDAGRVPLATDSAVKEPTAPFFAESDPQAQTEAIHVQVEARAALAQRHVCRLHKFIDCSTQNLYTTRELQGTVCTKHCNSTRFAELQAVVRCSECHRDRFGAALDIMATEMTGSCPTRYVSRFGSFDRL